MKKNKIIKIFVVIALLISIHVPIIAATTGVVNVDTARVRKRATTDSGIVVLVSIGDKVTIVGEEGNWYKVKVDGEEGYIRKDLLTVDGKNTTITPTEEPKEDNTQTEAPKENNTQVEEPKENDNQTGETNKNEEQQTQQPTNKNIPEEIEKKDTAISTLKTVARVSAGQRVQLTEETKIKILPSVNSSNIAKLSANTEVTILEVINKWCRVETEGACGWVRIDQ